MKKQLLTIAIVLGLGLTTSFAQGGLFQRGDVPTEEQGNSWPAWPWRFGSPRRSSR